MKLLGEVSSLHHSLVVYQMVCVPAHWTSLLASLRWYRQCHFFANHHNVIVFQYVLKTRDLALHLVPLAQQMPAFDFPVPLALVKHPTLLAERFFKLICPLRLRFQILFQQRNLPGLRCHLINECHSCHQDTFNVRVVRHSDFMIACVALGQNLMTILLGIGAKGIAAVIHVPLDVPPWETIRLKNLLHWEPPFSWLTRE